MKYRAEIDGLRAISVVPVILFHAGFELFSGGFVGVDVFFVISGYLITTILIDDIENNRFSLVNFYERRARRILPALFFVMFVCIPFAWMWMLPNQMKDFSESLGAVSLFTSNILFWTESGYFDAAAVEKPLLHTWSLAVEEQYYLLFPIFLFLAWRFGKNKVFWMLVVFTATSLALSEWGWRNHAKANFYLAPTRAWELFAGSIAAFIVQKRGVQENNLLSLLGLAAILFSIFAYDENTPFPSVYALVPVVGVILLVLFAEKETLAAKLLSTKLLVKIGLISYSAYLWHQPVFAFARIKLLEEPSIYLMSILSLLAMLLAVMSWRFVETPFRNKAFCNRHVVFVLSLSGMIAFVFFGLSGHSNNGFVQRLDDPELYEATMHRVRGNYGLSARCKTKFVATSECQTSDSPDILVWGDSYAMHIVAGLLADNPEVKLQQATVSQCAPILDYSVATAIHGALNCIEFNRQVFEYLKTSSVKYVVIASPFSRLFDDNSMVDANGKIYFNGATVTSNGIRSVLQKIREIGKIPVVISPPPSNGTDIGQCLVNAFLNGKDIKRCDFSESEIVAVKLKTESFLMGLGDVNLISLRSAICEDSQCSSSSDGVFIYRDSGHLSYEGSEFLGKKLGLFNRITMSK